MIHLALCAALILPSTIAPTGPESSSVHGGGDAESVAGVRYWPKKSREVRIEIDGYDFDFEKCKGAEGVVDGPWSHNGRYRIKRNDPGWFEMLVHFGADAKQRGDMDVRIVIKKGVGL